jgi:hypothetical protein
VEAVTSIAKSMLQQAEGVVAGGWCQGASARSLDGRPVPPWSDEATHWSAIGALVAVWASRREAAENLEREMAGFQRANLALLDVIGTAPRDWNDQPERARDDVLAAFARARESLDERSAA